MQKSYDRRGDPTDTRVNGNQVKWGVFMTLNLHCQLDQIYSHLGDTLILRLFPERFN